MTCDTVVLEYYAHEEPLQMSQISMDFAIKLLLFALQNCTFVRRKGHTKGNTCLHVLRGAAAGLTLDCMY